MPFFAEKPQIHNIKNGFYNFNNSNNLNNPCEQFGISEQLTAREANTISWEIVGAQLGEHWETAPVDIWDSLYMCM